MSMLTDVFVYQKVHPILRAPTQFQVSFEDLKYARLHDAVWLCKELLTLKQLGCLLLLPLSLLFILLHLLRCSLWHLLILWILSDVMFWSTLRSTS